MDSLPPADGLCSTCGEPLSAGGRCVACLLRGGLEETAAEAPAAAPLHYGDFEVARQADGSPWELGRGAMGVTYKAIDRVLHRAVALNQKAQAIREARQAVELVPITKDAVNYPYYATNLALVYSWTGEKDLAIEQLRLMATTPGGPAYGDLRLNPRWDLLRGDARFEAIVVSLTPK